MKRITSDELTEILRKHKLWLDDEPNGERADLSYAYLRNADLSYANLSGAKDANYPIACPEYGSFIGWKKAHDYIVKLKIAEDALRCSATSRKCRGSKAEVVAIEKMSGGVADIESVASSYDKSFIYRVGETVEVVDFDKNRWNECSTGIHFFITRKEAEDY